MLIYYAREDTNMTEQLSKGEQEIQDQVENQPWKEADKDIRFLKVLYYIYTGLEKPWEYLCPIASILLPSMTIILLMLCIATESFTIQNIITMVVSIPLSILAIKDTINIEIKKTLKKKESNNEACENEPSS